MTQMTSQRTLAGTAFLLLLVAAPFVMAQPVPGAERIQSPQRDEDVILNQAKQAYAKQVAEIERSNARMIEEALNKAQRKAQNAREKQLKPARAKLLDAYDAAIQRAIKAENMERVSRLKAEKQTIEAQWKPAAAVDLRQFKDKKFYKCVLGTYGRYARKTPYPVVNLSVPNRDLWSKTVQAKLQGKIEFHEINYRGHAKLIVPEDGVYILDIPGRGTGFEINGVTLKRGEMVLRKGMYQVEITTGTHGQPYLPDSFVRILRNGTDQELPLVNTGADIKKFLSSKIDHQAVIEVSGYRPEMVDATLPGLAPASRP